MLGLILSCFGYAKVPRESVLLCAAIKNKVLHLQVPEGQRLLLLDAICGLEGLEKLLRSACYFNKEGKQKTGKGGQ